MWTSLRTGSSWAFTQLFTGLMTIGGTLLFMLLIHWKIALVVIFITPLSLFVAQFVAKRTYSMFRLQSQIRGRQTALIDETIGGAKGGAGVWPPKQKPGRV